MKNSLFIGLGILAVWYYFGTRSEATVEAGPSADVPNEHVGNTGVTGGLRIPPTVPPHAREAAASYGLIA